MNSEHLGLSGFTRVHVRGVFKFDVVKAASFSVEIERAWYKNTRAFTAGDLLVVEHPWYDVIGWFTPWIRPRAIVKMPDLREVRVAGAGSGSVTGFVSSEDFKIGVYGASRLTGEVNAGTVAIEVAGASRLDLSTTARELKLSVAGASRYQGNLKADKAEIRIVGASHVAASGTVGDVIVRVAGASGLDSSDLTARNADVELAGASHGALRIDGKLDVTLVGASRFEYGGNPVMGNVRTVGASTLTRR